MRLRQFNLAHADDAVAGKGTLAGSPGTFNPALANNPSMVQLAPQSKRKDGGGVLRGNNRVHFGAVNGKFSTIGMVTLALVAAGLYIALKK
jgi:hypothetical protein